MEISLEDTVLLKIAMISCFLGLISLFAIMYFSEIPLKDIKSINDSDIGKKIKISGQLADVKYSSNNKTTFLKIHQECTIDVISFDPVIIDARSGNISVEGTLQEYNNKKEIIADKISIIK